MAIDFIPDYEGQTPLDKFMEENSMKGKCILIVFLVILLSGCAQAPPRAGQIPGKMQEIRGKPLPLTQTDKFLDLTERMYWTIRYPVGWTSSAVSPSGLGGRVIKEDAVGLTNASLTFTKMR